MIGLHVYVTGLDIAREMSGDMEEATQFFPGFAARLDDSDAADLLSMLKDEMFGCGGHDKLRALGELLVKAADSA